MLKVDPSLNHIPAGREHVIALFESINQPLVNIPNRGTAPTGAFVLGTRNDHGFYTVFVYLHQPKTQSVIIYVSDPRNLSAEQYPAEEAEAVRFVESMGFMVDNVHFPNLPPAEQETVMGRVPLFRPPSRTVDLYDATDPAPNLPVSDGIFGGLGATDSEVFRRAGMAGQSQPPLGYSASQPPASASFAPHLQRQPISGLGPPAQPPITGEIGVGAAGFASAAQEQPADPGVLERLGRLLGTFGFLVSLGLSHGCVTGQGAMSDKAVNTHIDLGNQHLSRGSYADAVRAFETVLQDQSENREALRGKAMAYLQLSKIPEAEELYRQTIDVAPDWSVPKNELAVILIETKRCPEAESLLTAVLGDIFYQTPEFAEHNLAKAEACQGKIDAAVNRLDGLVLKRPHFCLGYLTLAQMAARAKRPETTISACEGFRTNCEQHEKIKEHVLPQHSEMCYLQKGLAHAELGDVESARAAFRRCQSSAPFGKECRKSLNMLPP